MSKVPKWHVKAVYAIFALALVVSLSGAFVVSAAPASTAGAVGAEETINTLRIYGRGGENADFPYDDYRGPFVLGDDELGNVSNAPEVPPKDFIQWNPAYLRHSDDQSAGIYGSFYAKIKANAIDSSMKVHLRQWYVPEYCEPSGMVWANQGAVTSPDIVKEYTYMLVSPTTKNPIASSYGTQIAIPISDQDRIPELYPEIGLDDYDADNDGTADIVTVNQIGRVGGPFGPPAATTYAFSPCATTLVGAVNHQINAGTLWMDVSVDLTVGVGDEIRFFDHSFTITAFNAVTDSVRGDLAYSGNVEDDATFPDIILYQDETLSAGRHDSDVNVEDLTTDTAAVGIASPAAPPSQSEAFIAGTSYLRLIKAPWYLQVTSVSAGGVGVTVGRLLVEGEAFFVDGAEYEIAKLHTVCCTNASVCDHTVEIPSIYVNPGAYGEFVGTGDASNTIFPSGHGVTFASCDGSYFADCDTDLDIDAYQVADSSPDIIAYVNGVASDIANFDRVAGTVNLTAAPALGATVTISYCYHPEAFKYITIRNGIPKTDDVELDALSVVKAGVQECPENLPVIPPFNFEHDIVDDTNIPDAFSFMYEDDNGEYQDCPMPDVQLPDNLADANDLNSPDTVDWGTFVDVPAISGTAADRATQDDTLVMVTCSPATFTWLAQADGYGDITFLPFAYNTLVERMIYDVDSVEECWVQEQKEPRFDTNYLEEKFCEGCEDCQVTCVDECGDPYPTPCVECAEEYECYEEWRWINIETLPWLYTEMQLPEQPDITDPVNGDDGDYILVSSWATEDSATPTCADDGDDCTDCTCGSPAYNPIIRMKLVYDAAVGEVNSADIYVNDGIYNTEYNDEDSDPTTTIDVASLRIYGKCNLSAAFPYTTYQGPFDLTSSEAPPKDFIQWNPAYLDHDDAASLGDYGDFFSDIEASNIDANEKVHLRQWYVPKYQEPSGMVWYDGVSGVCDIGPSIIKEYTYTLLDPDNNPVAGKPGMSALVLPVADQPSNAQIGLDSVDVNNDGTADITHLETISAVDPTAGNDDGDALWPAYDRTEAYSCASGLVTANNEIPGLTRWIDISTGRIKVEEGDEIRFLDHSLVITDISTSVSFDCYFIGRRYLQDDKITGSPVAVNVGQTFSAGRTPYGVETLTGSPSLPPSQSPEFKEGNAAGGSNLQLIQRPWYAQVLSISDGYANIVVGRVLVEGESFFVDGAEYEIARIHTCPLPANGDALAGGPNLSEYGLKYITIRSDLPKFTSDLNPCEESDREVDLGSMSIWKMRIHPCYEWPCDSYIYTECNPDYTVSTCIPFLPPFNSVHDMVDDINIPEASNSLDPDEQEIDNSASSHIAACYDTIDERIVTDVAAIEECWKDEDKETRYDTNLLEEKFTENSTTLAEYWEWKNIETLPWDYTEFVLPALPDKPTEDGYTTGDYIVVTSFLTQDTNCYCSDEECTSGTCSSCSLQTIRMKFVYDQEYSLTDTSKTGLYVNTINVCEAWPIADAGGPYTGEAGVAVSLDGSASGASSPYTYAWDLDNDGFYDDSTMEDPSNTWATAGSYTVGLKVTDSLGCVGYDTASVTITAPTTCPDPIEIDASPFLGVYPGPDCALPAAVTNIDGDDCTAITIWGVEGGSWKSYDVDSGAGELGTYGLDAGQAYVITHEDCLGTDWVMCCDYP